MRWLLSQFGTGVIYRDPILPTADFLSTEAYAASEADIEDLVADLSELMLVDRAVFDLELFDSNDDAGTDTTADSAVGSGRKRAVGHFRRRGGRMVISLDRQEAVDPRYLTAIIVHELCHLRLRGEGRVGRD